MVLRRRKRRKRDRFLCEVSETNYLKVLLMGRKTFVLTNKDVLCMLQQINVSLASGYKTVVSPSPITSCIHLLENKCTQMASRVNIMRCSNAKMSCQEI